MFLFFFFQAEDGIRDLTVTGVQTCALPIADRACQEAPGRLDVQLGGQRLAAASHRGDLQDDGRPGSAARAVQGRRAATARLDQRRSLAHLRHRPCGRAVDQEQAGAGDSRHQRRAGCRAARGPDPERGGAARLYRGRLERAGGPGRDPRADRREDPRRRGEDLPAARYARKADRPGGGPGDLHAGGIHRAGQVRDRQVVESREGLGREARLIGSPSMSAAAPIAAQANAPTAELARFIANLEYDQLPAAVRERVKDIILDTLASAIAGRHGDESRQIRALATALGASREASVIGGEPLSPAGATLQNGYLITAVTVCDVHRPTLCHTTPQVVPPALAIAERNGASGRALILAVAAGLETTVRVGLGTKYPAFRAKGWHSPGVIGPFGGAAAAGKVLGLDAPRQRQG